VLFAQQECVALLLIVMLLLIVIVRKLAMPPPLPGLSRSPAALSWMEQPLSINVP
jgi:hypothetical protein